MVNEYKWVLFIILDWIFRVKFIARERDVFNRLTVCMTRTWGTVVTVATQRSKTTYIWHIRQWTTILCIRMGLIQFHDNGALIKCNVKGGKFVFVPGERLFFWSGARRWRGCLYNWVAIYWVIVIGAFVGVILGLLFVMNTNANESYFYNILFRY